MCCQASARQMWSGQGWCEQRLQRLEQLNTSSTCRWEAEVKLQTEGIREGRAHPLGSQLRCCDTLLADWTQCLRAAALFYHEVTHHSTKLLALLACHLAVFYRTRLESRRASRARLSLLCAQVPHLKPLNGVQDLLAQVKLYVGSRLLVDSVRGLHTTLRVSLQGTS